MGKRIETWKAIPGYEGLYECSDLGNVRSLDSTHSYVDSWNRKVVRSRKGKALSPGVNTGGYQFVALFKDGVKETVRINRLVLFTFVGKPEGYQESCHNNGRRADNRLVNLRWDSNTKNIRDKIKHGTMLRGAQIGTSKLTEEQVLQIRHWRPKAYLWELADHFNVSTTQISDIISGKSWQHMQTV